MGNFNELFSVVDKFSSAGSNVNIMLKLCLNIIIIFQGFRSVVCFGVLVFTINILSLFHNSRTQHGSQREPSVNPLHFPLSSEFLRHCVLNGGTQRRALPLHRNKEMEI